MPDTSILSILMSETVEYLIQVMTTEVVDNDPTDETKAGIIRTGRLQDDPLKPKVTVLIKMGDDDWAHQLNMNNYGPGMHGPTYEVGSFAGNPHWRRRFIADIDVYYKSKDRWDIQDKSNVILSRAENALLSMPIPQTADSFGEKAYQINVEKSTSRESGGPGTFIHHSAIYFEFLTQKNL
jgi:hypothetical protein